MTLVFFYGTLMTGFDRRRRLGMDDQLTFRGRGWIRARCSTLACIPRRCLRRTARSGARSSRSTNPTPVLAALDEIEGYDASTPDTSLYVRRQVPVHLDDDAEAEAWAYFYNAPLGQARRIASGDYLTHLKVK